MTTIELGAAIQRELDRMEGNETMMKQALQALRRIGCSFALSTENFPFLGMERRERG